MNRVALMAVGALAVLFILAPGQDWGQDSVLADVVGSPDDMHAVFRWAFVVAGGSAFLSGAFGIRRLLRERRRSGRP